MHYLHLHLINHPQIHLIYFLQNKFTLPDWKKFQAAQMCFTFSSKVSFNQNHNVHNSGTVAYRLLDGNCLLHLFRVSNLVQLMLRSHCAEVPSIARIHRRQCPHFTIALVKRTNQKWPIKYADKSKRSVNATCSKISTSTFFLLVLPCPRKGHCENIPELIWQASACSDKAARIQ